PLALPAQRLCAQLLEPVLHGVDHRAHLPLAGGGGDDEDVGQRQLAGDVQPHDVARQLVLGRRGGGLRQLDRPGGGTGGGTHEVSSWYRPYLWMYWTMPSGTRYHTGSPAAVRSRQSVEEMAMAGTSSRVTLSCGSPLSVRSWPGRVTPTKWAS